MKTFGRYSIVIVLALLLAAAQPGVGVPEVQAARAIAGPDLVPSCRSSACVVGWQAAYDHAINDEAECRLVSAEPAEVAGCEAFVQWARDEAELQALVDSGH